MKINTLLLSGLILVCGAAFAETETRIQVLVKDDTGFMDALYFTPEQYKTTTQAEINAMAEERIALYHQRIEEASAQEAPEPTEEELK